MSVLCQVFKSPRKEEMYLYVEKSRGLVDVPEALMARFGEPQPVMVVMLDQERNLARANTPVSEAQHDVQGFYLQMPPTTAQLLRMAAGTGQMVAGKIAGSVHRY